MRTNHVSSNDEQRISGNRISSFNRTVHTSFHLVFLKLDILFMYFSCHNYSRKHHWWTILSPFNVIFFYISCFWFDASGIFMGKKRIDNHKVGNTVLLRKIRRVLVMSKRSIECWIGREIDYEEYILEAIHSWFFFFFLILKYIDNFIFVYILLLYSRWHLYR